jgi:hypothetical protein
MNNPYKRMFVLSEEEYNRLKLFQQQQHHQQKKDEKVADTGTNVEEEHITVNVAAPPPPPPPSPHYYSCSTCGKKYKHKRDLRRHVKLLHGIAPPLAAIIPVIEKKKKKKQKNKVSTKHLHVFDKVKKWMTIRS